ncbi:MAG: four-helix bundle copper-binding protein [Actinomycetota bacterium]|nr:four-helix bundle copper-binding protein [Actinomycetota bacterium]
MTHAQQMLKTHPRGSALPEAALVECIEACLDCSQSCTACADACLGEEDVGTVIRCIRLCNDCSDVCATTGRLLSRQTGFEGALVRAVVQACIELCRACGEESARHADHHPHCRVCAEACRGCERACWNLLSALGA